MFGGFSAEQNRDTQFLFHGSTLEKKNGLRFEGPHEHGEGGAVMISWLRGLAVR
jgi:hypothetical protein